MKKLILLTLLLLFTVSCGSNKANKVGVSAGVVLTWPESLTTFEASSYKLYGSLLDEDGVMISDSIGEPFEGRYYFDFGWIADGEYLYRLNIKYSGEDAEIPVAVAEKSVDLVDGDNFFVIGEEEFSDIGGGDIDSDTLSNLTELQLGLNPLLLDTDGDDVPDNVDIFPSISSEWLDTDSDGIGDNTDEDIDGDGLDNDTELSIGTDVYDPDSDGDSIIDAVDNCRLRSNASQSDVDGDGSGDACDDDTDGDGLTDAEEGTYGTNIADTDSDDDGLSDKREIDIGTNPLIADTDDDRYDDKVDAFPLNSTEWFDTDKDTIGDNTDNCKFTPNADQINTDRRLSLEDRPANPDQCGDACEHECDNDIDGDGLNYVYVDASNGDDENLGIFSEPVESIERGIALAYGRNEDAILVAGGNYDLKDVVFRIGIDLYGGYNRVSFTNHSNARDIRSEDSPFLTKLINSESSTTLHLGSEVGTIFVEGFYIENTADSSISTTVRLSNSEITLRGNKIVANGEAEAVNGIDIAGGSPVIDANWMERSDDEVGRESKGIYSESGNPIITNNIIRAGGSRHAVAVELNSSNAIIVNNTLDGSSNVDPPGTSTGLVFRDSEPVVVNNIIVASPGDNSDAVAVKCFGISPDDGEFQNNILSTFSLGSSDALVIDCNRSHYYTADFNIGGIDVDDNIAFSGSFDELLDASYGLIADDVGVDMGMDTDSESYGSVVKDFNLNDRESGSYDIGAKERP